MENLDPEGPEIYRCRQNELMSVVKMLRTPARIASRMTARSPGLGNGLASRP